MRPELLKVMASVQERTIDGASDVLNQVAIDLSRHSLPPYEDLARTLSQFRKLRKLNLSSIEWGGHHTMGLDSVKFIGNAVAESKREAKKRRSANGTEELAETWFGKDLTTLNLSGNISLPISRKKDGTDPLVGLEQLPNLYCELDWPIDELFAWY